MLLDACVSLYIALLSDQGDVPIVCTGGRAVVVIGREVAVSNGDDAPGSAGGIVVAIGVTLGSTTGVGGDGTQLLVHETTTPSIVAKTMSGPCLAWTRFVLLPEEVVKA